MLEELPIVHITKDGEPRASTEMIAIGFGLKHKNVLSLVRKHQEELDHFGLLAFQTRPRSKGQHGGGDVEFALLNERQAMLLISLMRNTIKVLAFKVRLVSEFANMADALHNRDLTMWERRIRLEARDLTSKAKGSMGSRLMTQRKQEITVIEAERHVLENAMQPALLN